MRESTEENRTKMALKSQNLKQFEHQGPMRDGGRDGGKGHTPPHFYFTIGPNANVKIF